MRFWMAYLGLISAVACAAPGQPNPDDATTLRDLPVDEDFRNDTAMPEPDVPPEAVVEETLDDATTCPTKPLHPLANCPATACATTWPFCEPAGADQAQLQEELQQFYRYNGVCAVPPTQLTCRLNSLGTTAERLAAIDSQIGKVPISKQDDLRCFVAPGAARGPLVVDWTVREGLQSLSLTMDAELSLGVEGEASQQAFLELLGPIIGRLVGIPNDMELRVQTNWFDTGSTPGGSIRIDASRYRGLPTVGEIVYVAVPHISEAPCAGRVRFQSLLSSIAIGLGELDVDPADELDQDLAVARALQLCGSHCKFEPDATSFPPAWRGVVRASTGARVAWLIALKCSDDPRFVCPCTYAIDALTGDNIPDAAMPCLM